MSKKLFVSLIIAIFAIFSFTMCFAATNNETKANNNGDGGLLGEAANGVRNFVGGAENTIENAAMGISNTSKNMTGDVVNTMGGNNDNNNGNTGNTGNTNTNNNNDDSTFMGMGTTGDNGGYTATRTATGTGADDTTVLGMSSTAWTWLILGITAIGIIAIVWYYSTQFTNVNRKDNE